MKASPSEEVKFRSKIFSKIALFFIGFAIAGSHAQAQTEICPEDTAAIKAVASSTPLKKKKKIYITFDDGPNRGTKNLLDIIKKEQIPVSFFIVGQQVFRSNGHEQLFDSLRSTQNIELCNHSFTHAASKYSKFYKSPRTVVLDFRRAQDSLKFTNDIARTPGRNIWRLDSLSATDQKKSTAAGDSLKNAGFILLGWDVEWQFDSSMKVTRTAEKLLADIDRTFKHHGTKVRDHLVILTHDQGFSSKYNCGQLLKLIQLLKKREDYEFAFASEYPGTEKKGDLSISKNTTLENYSLHKLEFR